MATLSREEQKNRKRNKLILLVIITIFVLFFVPLVANVLCYFLYLSAGNENPIKSLGYFSAVYNMTTIKQVREAGIFLVIGYLLFMIFNYRSPTKIANTKTVKLTDDIEIPVAVGDGQHGNGRLMSEEEKEVKFDVFEYKNEKSLQNLKNAGIVVQNIQLNNKDIYYFLGGDFHSILFGPTRSGKGQRVLLKTMWLILNANENGLIIDPKLDSYYFTHKYARKKGHEVVVLDFIQPRKSLHFNYLSEINDLIDKGDVVNAIDKTWDLVSVLVGQPKGEPIWHDGTCSVIAANILIVSSDAPKDCRNLTNVYCFLAYMCEPQEDDYIPINDYVDKLSDYHPAKLVFQVAKISHWRTRSSFYTQALTILRNFTNWNIAEMTSKSDFNLKEIIKTKSVIYVGIPDEKDTLYGLASLFITQHYMTCIDVSRENGNRLPIQHNNILDEFGNLPVIPVINGMMTAGAGRGIKNTLVLQDYQQLKEKYKESFSTIKNNAEVKILLKTSDDETVKSFSDTSGTYTVQVASAGVSASESSKRLDVSTSSQASMTGRKVLDTDAVRLIKEPHALVYKTGERLALMHLPKMQGSQAQEDLGLGDQNFNQKLIIEQEKEREERVVGPPKLWGIWKEYTSKEKNNIKNHSSEEVVSFLSGN